MTPLDFNGRTVTECKRCHGRGKIPHYGHVLKGICFECDGAGVKLYGLLAARRRRMGMRGATSRREVPAALALVRVGAA
jgi:hypothetical protein